MANWRTELGKPRLTLEEFHKLCADAVAQLFPDVVVRSGQTPGQLLVSRGDAEPLTVFLGNLWSSCRHEPDLRAEKVERFLRVIAGPKTESHGQPDIQCIVPMIKDHGYLSFTDPKTGQPNFVHEHFAGDLWIIYAIDQPDRMTTLQQSQFESLGLARGSLKQLAVENLKRILPPVERHGEGPLYMLTAGSDYVASLILFDELWEEFQDLVEGDVVAAVPSRDVLLFTGSGSAVGIRAMRESINRVTATGGYLVSTTMLRRHPEGWKVFS